MKSLAVKWSDSKQQDLQERLSGYWLEDEWCFRYCPIDDGCDEYKGKTIYFTCSSSTLKAEVKFACWQKLERKEWKTKTLWSKAHDIKVISDWLNKARPKLVSLLELDLTTLATSLRSYLVNAGLWKGRAQSKLNRNQEMQKYNSSGELNTLRQIYKVIQEFYDDRDEYEKEVWDTRKLGIKANPARSSYTLNFSKIHQPWLLSAAKTFIRYGLSTLSLSECQSRLSVLNNFSTFLKKEYPGLLPIDIDRPLVLAYLSYLTGAGLESGSRYRHIGKLKVFLELCSREGWAPVPDKRFFYSEDFPRLEKRQPRFIPEEVLAQLNEHLDALPDHIRRMVLILQEVGMRISELCRMPFNCLMQDAQGDFFLRYYQYKMKKDHSVPISKEVAAVIQEQQQVVKAVQGEFPYLFPSPRQWHKGQPMKELAFARALNNLAYEKNICDTSGTLWRFQAHQFRHTVGTRMINLGVPQHIIQQYLGHESPEMTSVYAHIYDQTMKAEFAKFTGKLVDVMGKKIVPQGTPVESLEFQWFKKNILAQALPNGSCALPLVAGECPHANACLTCAHFRTDGRFLSEHKKQLQQTEKLIETAKTNGWVRQAEMNQQVQDNLKSIIAALEDSNEAST